jgi:DNA-3-methyladenine glycosylase I
VPTRCPWKTNDPLLLRYHDEEWGVPVHDDRLLFEYLVLGGAQAGLSWSTVLRKREAYRAAFDRFDPHRVARYDSARIEWLLANPGLIRNRNKLQSAVENARALLAVQEECGSFDQYVWDFVGGRPIQNAWPSLEEIPTKTPESVALSKDLRRRGFRFAGPTIVYAFMQAVGMVNDHVTTCFRHRELGGASDR